MEEKLQRPLIEPAAMLRRRAFVDAAREAFFKHGYGGTTMSAISAKVGGSKTTLWAYFPSKGALFEAVVDDIVDQYGEVLSIELPVTKDVDDALRHFGSIFLDMLMLAPISALHRLVIGEAKRFPNLAEAFYERGPRRGKARLASWMSALMDQGYLRAGDADVAARQFLGLCQSGVYQETLFGLPDIGDNPAHASDIETAVGTFCRAWGLA